MVTEEAMKIADETYFQSWLDKMKEKNREKRKHFSNLKYNRI
jgi:hypothetical protein